MFPLVAVKTFDFFLNAYFTPDVNGETLTNRDI
jgi:hypothetical protein